MKNYSQLINESQYSRSEEILRSEITDYINKLKKSLPVDVQKAIYLTNKYNITKSTDIDDIRKANKSKLKDFVNKLNMPLSELEDLWTLLKSMKQNYKIMPQYISASDREQIMKGQMALDDVTIDLETSAGRNAVTKLFTPVVIGIVNQLIQKGQMASLTRSDMISAGMLGLANAMNQWKGKNPEDLTDENGKKIKVVSFRQYASYRIRQQIMNDVDSYGHALSGTNWYSSKKAKEAGDYSSIDAVSLDDLGDLSHVGSLGTDGITKDAQPLFKKLYDIMAKNFTHRDMDIFYRYFGLNGHPKEKSKDIAKSYGMSEGNIQNGVLKKIMKFLSNHRDCMEIFLELRDMYNESILPAMIDCTREQIIERLANDDIYVLFEELINENNPTSILQQYNAAMNRMSDKDQDKIKEMLLGGFQNIDRSIRKENEIIRSFLKFMYPMEYFKTDGDVIMAMTKLSEIIKDKQIKL